MSNALMSIELMTCIAAISLAPAEARAQDRPDCPGKIICPVTGDLVCKDRCPLGENEAVRTPQCCAADAPAVSPGMVSLQDRDGNRRLARNPTSVGINSTDSTVSSRANFAS